MGFILNPYRYSGAGLYNDMLVAYSFRKFNNWSNAAIKIRRSSDNAQAYVFFDGATSYDTITLNSYISTSSNTTPDATTLATWVSSDNAGITEIYGQTPDNILDAAYTLTQATTADQPAFMLAGSLYQNYLSTTGVYCDLPGVTASLNGSAISELASGNTFTSFGVGFDDVTTGVGTLYSTSLGTYRHQVFIDRRTQKRINTINTSIGLYAADLTAQVDSGSARLVTNIVRASDMDSYYNGTAQNTGVSWSGTYTNDSFNLFEATGNNLKGGFMELLFFTSDKTSDLTDIHDEINTYYSIY